MQKLRGTSASSQVRALYRPELDMLRFFAFLGVFMLHGFDVNPAGRLVHTHPHLAQLIVTAHYLGSFGLSLFFVLSAFLITSLLFLEKEGAGHVDLRRFYLRRMLRIWPLYLGFVLVAFGLGRIWPEMRVGCWELLALCLMYANWFWMRATVFAGVLIPLWSIAVEEQFYLVWPLAVQRLRRGGFAWLCCGVAAASLVCTWLSDTPKTTLLHLWFNTGVEAIFFAAGGLMALAFGLEEKRRSALKFMAALAVTAACWLAAERLASASQNFSHVQPGHAVGAFLLIALGASSLLWGFLHMPRVLIHSWLVYLGRISFGLYVFHYLALRLGAATIGHFLHSRVWVLAAFLLTVGLAQLSYVYYERRFLHRKFRLERVHSVPDRI